jgi:cation transport ATPase
MARALSEAEIARLQARLKADAITPGWLRARLWRRGWMLPPPLFLPIHIELTLTALLFGSIWLGSDYTHALALYILVLMIVSLLPFVRAIWRSWRRRDAWKRRLWQLALVGLIVAIGIGSIAIAWPQAWPSPTQFIANLRANLIWLIIFPCAAYPYHASTRVAKALPSWRDYVARGLAIEAF